jgi:hypothetical protein
MQGTDVAVAVPQEETFVKLIISSVLKTGLVFLE